VTGSYVVDSGPDTTSLPPHRSKRKVAAWRPGRRWALHSAQLALVAIALGTWQVVGTGSKTQSLTIGTPSAVCRWIGGWLVGHQGSGLHDLVVTVKEAFYGFVLGVVAGVLLAVILSSSRWLCDYAAPFVSLLNALPKIALAPLFLLIFGNTTKSRVYFVCAAILFITFYNVFGGLRSLNRELLANAKILGASRLWLVREVYFPSITSWLLAGLRLTSAWAFAAAVVAEYLSASSGMGYVISTGEENVSPTQVIGGLAVVAIVALVVDRVLLQVEKRLSVWRAN
jgi:NitT/TauT family transport system permease protein